MTLRPLFFWIALVVAGFFAYPADAQQWQDTDPGIFYDGGNVGVGLQNPLEDLHVDATSGHNTIRLGRASYLQESDNKRRLFLGANIYDDESDSWSRQSSTHGAVGVDLVADDGDWGSYLRFLVDDGGTYFPTEQMRITSDGKVGIGTETPLNFAENRGLHLDRGGHSSLMVGDGINDGGIIQASDNQQRLFFGVNVYDGSSDTPWDRFDSDGAAGIDVIAGGEASENFVRFLVDPSGAGFPAERMRITESGNVGIGTSEPGQKLAVNGTTRTKEVIVESENWPDYVFEEDYDLRSPAELASFIDREGHLPALPSAEEVERKGQTVGTVQRGLVQTVEELARYAIEQRRRADSLAARMETRHARQQEQIDTLRRQLQQLRDQVNEE